jgi:hypothetical protein
LTQQDCSAVVEFRGDGDGVEKSARLLSVSVQPLATRNSAMLFVSGAADAPSKQLAAPYPTKSTMPVPGQAPDREVALLTSANLPAIALKLIPPLASGVGRLAVPLPAAAATR